MLSFIGKSKTATLTQKIQNGNLFQLRFYCESLRSYSAGQFISVLVPTPGGQTVKRLYSLASACENSLENLHELCIKRVDGGLGSNFLTGLRVGETFQFQAPFGCFKFESGRRRPVIFIGTGSGIAPLRAIAMSTEFAKGDVPFALGIFGFRTVSDVPYRGEFERLGIPTRIAISKDLSVNKDFRLGRVTDVLRGLRSDFPWRDCDYYICGNPDMIAETLELLIAKRVPASAIFFESFGTNVSGLDSALQVGGDRAA